MVSPYDFYSFPNGKHLNVKEATCVFLTHVWAVGPAPGSGCCWSSPSCCRPPQSQSGASGSSQSCRRRTARSALLSRGHWSSGAGLEIHPHSTRAPICAAAVRRVAVGGSRGTARDILNTRTITNQRVWISADGLYLKQQGDVGLTYVGIVLENPPEVGAAFRSCVRDRELGQLPASTSDSWATARMSQVRPECFQLPGRASQL